MRQRLSSSKTWMMEERFASPSVRSRALAKSDLNGPLSVLTDGTMGLTQGNAAEAFFFQDVDDGGTIRLTLSSIKGISQIRSEWPTLGADRWNDGVDSRQCGRGFLLPRRG